MGRTYQTLEPAVVTFIERQHMFFVATAPSEGGHVNMSPKGLDSLRILNDHRIVYLDLTGSGAETIAHVRENQRITIMFCAFEGPPRIIRAYGVGEVSLLGQPEYHELAQLFPEHRGARAIISVAVEQVADSCGYSIPLYDFVADRDVLDKWTERRSDEELQDYRRSKNTRSIDGLPAWQEVPLVGP